VKQTVVSLFLLFGLIFVVGCSQSGSSAMENPVGTSMPAMANSDGSSSQTPVTTAGASKSLICHNDVDEEEAYDSISILVSDSSVETHFANHGDCYTSDPVGTENCSCAL
jgi:hypothetical protein